LNDTNYTLQTDKRTKTE